MVQHDSSRETVADVINHISQLSEVLASDEGTQAASSTLSVIDTTLQKSMVFNPNIKPVLRLILITDFYRFAAVLLS